MRATSSRRRSRGRRRSRSRPGRRRSSRPSSGRSTSRRSGGTSAGSSAASRPSVWITRSSGLGTFQTSLTPSSHTWGSRPSARSNSRIAGPVRWPQQPSASTVALATTSVPGSKLPSGSPSLPRPLSPVRTPTTRPSSTSSCVGRRLGEDVRAALLGLRLLVAGEPGDRDDLVAVVLLRRRRRDADLRLRRWAGGRSPPSRPRRRRSPPCASPPASCPGRGPRSGPRAHDRAGQVVPAARLRLLDDRDRHLAEALHHVGVVAEQLEQPVGARPARRCRRRRCRRRPR